MSGEVEGEDTMKKINKRVVGGALSIVSGTVFLVAGAMIIGAESRGNEGIPLIALVFAMISLFLGGVMPIIGGIFALKGTRWEVALVGSMGAIIGFIFTGIPALILIIKSRNEFK